MTRKAHKKKQKRFFARHRILKLSLLGLLILVLGLVGWIAFSQIKVSRQQAKLQPFYNTQNLPANGALGEVVRQEALGFNVPNGTGIRVLYRTQRADNSYTFTSGMIFIPNNSNAGTPRPVVAWAHGTLGLGDQCAPSRTQHPTNIAGLSDMMQKGWVVTATDYSGFGTAGTQGYLIGGNEAHDVLNSVRAARNIASAQAGTNYTVWGHSQGGASALWTASQASAYAPELHLVGTVASAPAAELLPLLNEQYGTTIDWVIGPIVAASWPAYNSSLNLDILTTTGRNNYQRIANQCIAQSAIAGLIRHQLGQKFFSTNPIEVPTWRAMAQAQSAPVLTASQPLMVVESTQDMVVLPNTTSLYIQKSCQANDNVTSLWIDKGNHMQIPSLTAGNVVSWMSDRFANKVTTPNCSTPSPVAPANVPAD